MKLTFLCFDSEVPNVENSFGVLHEISAINLWTEKT